MNKDVSLCINDPNCFFVKISPRKYRLFFQILAVLAGPAVAQAQVAADTAATTVKSDSLPVDSATVDLRNIKISSEGLSEEVEYKARDSMWFDVK